MTIDERPVLVETTSCTNKAKLTVSHDNHIRIKVCQMGPWLRGEVIHVLTTAGLAALSQTRTKTLRATVRDLRHIRSRPQVVLTSKPRPTDKVRERLIIVRPADGW